MTIEKKIAHLVEKDFPAYYRDEGPIFVEFVKTYYEWLESQNQVNYHARNILDYKDIDTTVDDFIVYFKQKYLPDIQFDTATDVQQLVKHTLDLYRSKGTDRAIDLFFRLVYGKPAEIYYPAKDIFRLSDGKWIKPVYLEITSSPNNRVFINQQIVGLTSGATAFVERVIRRKIFSKWAEIMFISSVNGNFQTGEKITIDGNYQQDNPTILGSLNTLQIISGGQNFDVGDIVTLQSDNGVQGKGRVASITDYTGLVDFILIDGGWGYSANAEIYVSDKVLTISDSDANANSSTPYPVFDTITQPLANIQYDSANSTFPVGTTLYSYYSNNSLAGVGYVIESSNSSATNGTIKVSIGNGYFGVVAEPNINATANAVVSMYSKAVIGMQFLGNYAGTVNVVIGHRNVQGTSTVFDTDLYTRVPAYTGTVAMNTTSNVVIGTSTNFDKDCFTPTANLSGTVYINATSTAVLGTNSALTSFVANDYITVYTNSTFWQSRQVNSVINSTMLYVKNLFTFTNSAAAYNKGIMNPYINVNANTTRPQGRELVSVTNSTYLTVASLFSLGNSGVTYSNCYMKEYVSFGNSSHREILAVNNVVNSTVLWLKWPTEFTNSAAIVGSIGPSNTMFYVPFANVAGNAAFTANTMTVTGTGTDFTQFANGDLITLWANATTYDMKTIKQVVNATSLILSNVSPFTNATGKVANVIANSSYYYGKQMVLYGNSSTQLMVTINNVVNDSYLTVSSAIPFSNGAMKFANTKVGTKFFKAGNSAVGNSGVYSDISATAKVIGTKANVNFIVLNNSIRFANDTIVYQTNSTGFEVANARIISTSFTGTNTYLVVNGVYGVFKDNSILNSRNDAGTLLTANGTLANIQYQVGVVDVVNQFITNDNNFIYTSSNTNGIVTRVSKQNVKAGFSLNANSLTNQETVTFYDDMIKDYVSVFLNAETFKPYGVNVSSNLAISNIDTIISDALTNTAITLGQIDQLIAINPGTEYDTAPVVLVYEPKVAVANLRDYVLQIANSAGLFSDGEVLLQGGATVGIVRYANSTEIGVKRIRYAENFNKAIKIEGLASGANATILEIFSDPTTDLLGMNADIEANVVAVSGSVVNIEVVDSGIGYVDNETLSFVSADGSRSGLAVAKLEKQGTAEGYYASKGGFLSADKKIFDGNYYQEYSYEVRSPIVLDKYASMLKNVLHIAGTKFFASVVTPTYGDIKVNLNQYYQGISGRFKANSVNGNSILRTTNTSFVRVGDILNSSFVSNASILTINSSAIVMNKNANSTLNNSVVTYTR